MTALQSSAAQPQQQPQPQPLRGFGVKENPEKNSGTSRNDSSQVKPSQNQIPQARTRNARTPAHMNKAQGRPAQRTNNNEPDNSARAKRPGPRTKTLGPKGPSEEPPKGRPNSPPRGRLRRGGREPPNNQNSIRNPTRCRDRPQRPGPGRPFHRPSDAQPRSIDNQKTTPEAIREDFQGNSYLPTG